MPKRDQTSTTVWRIQHLLPSGEWYRGSLKLHDFDRAKEELDALREMQPGAEYRLVQYEVLETQEILDV